MKDIKQFNTSKHVFTVFYISWITLIKVIFNTNKTSLYDHSLQNTKTSAKNKYGKIY